MAPNDTTADLFLKFSREKLFDHYRPRLRTCVQSLSDEQIWWRPNEATNSVGNLLLHLQGNLQQWLVAPFEGIEDTRDRPAEFSQRDAAPGSVLLERLETTLKRAETALSRLSDADLHAIYQIQGYTVTGLHAVYQVVEHFGLHYGQIAYITKSLRGKDLGFYRHLDKTGRA